MAFGHRAAIQHRLGSLGFWANLVRVAKGRSILAVTRSAALADWAKVALVTQIQDRPFALLDA